VCCLAIAHLSPCTSCAPVSPPLSAAFVPSSAATRRLLYAQPSGEAVSSALAVSWVIAVLWDLLRCGYIYIHCRMVACPFSQG
jgi:hypothetical protein